MCVVLVALGCSAVDPESDDRYALSKVNGVTLPAEVVNETTADGRQHLVEIVSGHLAFYPRGTFRSRVALRSAWTNPVADTLSAVEFSGAFQMLKDTAAQVRYEDGGVWNRTNFRILESGQLLRAIQGFGGSLAAYDYRR